MQANKFIGCAYFSFYVFVFSFFFFHFFFHGLSRNNISVI